MANGLFLSLKNVCTVGLIYMLLFLLTLMVLNFWMVFRFLEIDLRMGVGVTYTQ